MVAEDGQNIPVNISGVPSIVTFLSLIALTLT